MKKLLTIQLLCANINAKRNINNHALNSLYPGQVWHKACRSQYKHPDILCLEYQSKLKQHVTVYMIEIEIHQFENKTEVNFHSNALQILGINDIKHAMIML